MSERYEILDAIMANPDPMIRQRLEMAYDAGRVSTLHEKNVFADDQDFNCAVTFQTAFANREITTLTARVDELEAENKRLKEREVAVFAKGYRNGYFDGSGGTTAFQSEVHEAFKKWDTSGRKTHLDIEADIARVDELEAENKRLREALNTIHKRIMGYEPDNRIEARFFGELKIVARKALDNKAE